MLKQFLKKYSKPILIISIPAITCLLPILIKTKVKLKFLKLF